MWFINVVQKLNIRFVHNNYMNSETQDKQELRYSQVLRTIAFTSLNSEFIISM